MKRSVLIVLFVSTGRPCLAFGQTQTARRQAGAGGQRLGYFVGT